MFCYNLVLYRDVKGRFMEPPHLKARHSIAAPYPYPYHSQQPTHSKESMETESQEDYVIIQDIETEPEIEAEAEAAMSVTMDESPDESNFEIADMPHTPFVSTPYTDGDQNFNTARTHAKSPWTSGSGFTYSDTRIIEEDDDNFDRRAVPLTPHLSSVNNREELFTSPIRPTFQLDQPFSLPFNSASKKSGFHTDTDTKSSASAIRRVFEDMTSSFSPVEASAKKERLPTRRKVRFSEG